MLLYGLVVPKLIKYEGNIGIKISMSAQIIEFQNMNQCYKNILKREIG